jgi:hypothetical protein
LGVLVADSPRCHRDIVRQEMELAPAVRGVLSYNAAGLASPAVVSRETGQAAFFAASIRRCSTKIGCAHGESFFFLLVIKVSSDGS